MSVSSAPIVRLSVTIADASVRFEEEPSIIVLPMSCPPALSVYVGVEPLKVVVAVPFVNVPLAPIVKSPLIFMSLLPRERAPSVIVKVDDELS